MQRKQNQKSLFSFISEKAKRKKRKETAGKQKEKILNQQNAKASPSENIWRLGIRDGKSSKDKASIKNSNLYEHLAEEIEAKEKG